MSRITIVIPTGQGPRSGNGVTARRWASLLRALKHNVTVTDSSQRNNCELLVALHAKRSAARIAAVRKLFPQVPIVVALTGTDLYHDIKTSPAAKKSLELADRLIVLQERGAAGLPTKYRSKVRCIFQSAEATIGARPLKSVFEISVVGHLRTVKDPFRAEMASRKLPAQSRMRITHIGAALSDAMSKKAVSAKHKNPRYQWLGDQTCSRARNIIARSKAIVVSSKMEGGANVICEAVVDNVPVLASKVDGNVGMLGDDYSGYFNFGDTAQLRKLMLRLESDDPFYRHLQMQCRKRAALFSAKQERAALAALLREFGL